MNLFPYVFILNYFQTAQVQFYLREIINTKLCQNARGSLKSVRLTWKFL